MAVRVTATQVKAIMDTELTDAQVDAYIVSANVMVNEIMGTTEVTDVLTELERWLSAHLIAITRERQAAKEGAEEASITYTGKYGMALQSTSYGQMVLTLDVSGAFANASDAKQPIVWKAIQSFD
jgi:hypothetical protein